MKEVTNHADNLSEQDGNKQDGIQNVDENLSLVIEKIGIAGYRELQKNGNVSIEETAAAIRALEARGEPLEDPIDPDDPPSEKPEPSSPSRKSGRPALTLDILRQFLEDSEISVKYNVITKETEISGMSGVFNPESLTAELHIILHDQLKSSFQCTKDNVADLLGVIAGQNRYNPVTDLLDSAVWDGKDHFRELLDILHIDDTLSKTLIYKWMLQAVAMARNELHGAYGADGVLCFAGPQGIGKTTLVRAFGMRPGLFKLGQYIDSRDKDTARRCTSAWIVELAELETTFRSDIERLKAFITAERDEYRLPYGRADQIMARRTAFIATCNSVKFLLDATGNRRFWTVPLEKIDLDRLASFDMLQLWKQAEVSADAESFRLTAAERIALEKRNRGHEKPLKSQEEIEDIFSAAEENPDAYEWRFDTVSSFKAQYGSLQRYTVQQIGAALDKLEIKNERKKIAGKTQRGRVLPFGKGEQ